MSILRARVYIAFIMILLSHLAIASDQNNSGPSDSNSGEEAAYNERLKEIQSAMLRLVDKIHARVIDPANQNAATQYLFAKAAAMEFIRMVVRAGESDRIIDASRRVWTRSEIEEALKDKLIDANVAREVAIKKGFSKEVFYRDFESGFFRYAENTVFRAIKLTDKGALSEAIGRDGITSHALTQTREDLYYIGWATFTDTNVALEYNKKAEELKTHYAGVIRAIESHQGAIAAYEFASGQPFESLKIPLHFQQHPKIEDFMSTACRALLKKTSKPD